MTISNQPNPPDPRRLLASISDLLQADPVKNLIATSARPLVLDALREALDTYRRGLKPGDAQPTMDEIIDRCEGILRRNEADRLRPVINATGIILHTGLGRAVLPRRAVEALAGQERCCNLQIDMETGRRGKRNAASEALMTRLTGAEAAMIVNNNAAATLLILAALCPGREVIVSRGQLIEIGGSYRLPDCVLQSGAELVEVGTTNKTHLRDYERAITENTGAIMRVNPSNYRVVGFSKEVAIGDLVSLKAHHDVLVIDDLGCGALVDLSQYGLPKEPTVPESIAAGADLACFSGDKLIGGPQAGIIVGRKDLIQKIRKHPLTRMLRVDKMVDLALEQTLRLFLEPETLMQTNPTYQMLTQPPERLRERAERLKQQIQNNGNPKLDVRVLEGESAVGGGSLPATPIPTWLLAVRVKGVSAEVLNQRLRQHEPPIIARIDQGEVLLDLRTIFEDEEAAIVQAVARDA